MSLPLRVRIAGWFVVLLALILTAFSAFLIVRLRADLVGAIDNTLQPAAAQIGHDVSLEGVTEFRDSAGTVLRGERPAAQLLTPAGAVVTRFGDAVARRPMTSLADIGQASRGHPTVRSRTLAPGNDDFRVTSVGVTAHDGRRYVIVAALSSESVDRSVGRLVRLLLLGGSTALVLAALAGWWLARRALRPIEMLANTADAIGVDRLADRVTPGRSRDEVAHLASTINMMLDRIQQGVLEQRRLVADTSHELRTPLAVMRSELDVSLRGDELPPAARDVLLSAREEVDALSRTVDDLLTLAAADDGPAAPTTQAIDLAALARAATRALTAVAQEHGVTVAHDGPAIAVSGDPRRLQQAVRNVLENAITFSPPGGTVRVETSVHGDRGQLRITDQGPGIPEALRERVFDRFFRVDASRSRATGGSGLGLAITREIVDAHGGRIHVEGAAPGSVFVIDLPLRGPARSHQSPARELGVQRRCNPLR